MIILPLMMVLDGKVLIPPNIGGKVIILNWTYTFHLEVWLYVITGSKNKETRSNFARNSIKLVKNVERTSQKSRKTGKDFKLYEEFDKTGSKIYWTSSKVHGRQYKNHGRQY